MRLAARHRARTRRSAASGFRRGRARNAVRDRAGTATHRAPSATARRVVSRHVMSPSRKRRWLLPQVRSGTCAPQSASGRRRTRMRGLPDSGRIVPHQHHRAIEAAVLAPARREIGDLDRAAVAVVQHRAQHRGVLDVVLLGAVEVLRARIEPVAAIDHAAAAARRSRIAVERRHAAPDDAPARVDQRAEAAVADQAQVEVGVASACASDGLLVAIAASHVADGRRIGQCVMRGAGFARRRRAR